MEKRTFTCESCDEEYEVHWENDFDEPEYCPFCGDMIEDDDHDDHDDEDEDEDYDDFYSKLRHK